MSYFTLKNFKQQFLVLSFLKNVKASYLETNVIDIMNRRIKDDNLRKKEKL